MSTIVQGDSSWGGVGSLDQTRHAEKLKQAIQEQLPTVIGQTPIITGDPRQPVRVTVPILEVPRFRPKGPDQPPSAGIGQGPAQPGDVIGHRRRPDAGNGAGNSGAEHPVTVEIARETLLQWVFEDLALPRLTDREPPRLPETAPAWRSRRRHGPLATLDKHATLEAALAHALAEGKPLRFTPDDLRFRAAVDEPRPATNAVIYLVRDISGSMAGDRTYLSRVLAWWLVQWVRWQYTAVALEWWVHDADPERVETEERFFGLEAAGGTLVAPTYAAIRDHLAQYYPAAAWNAYLLHLTDGEVFDGDAATAPARALCDRLNAFWLAEIAPWNRPEWHAWSLGRDWTAALPDPPFRTAQLRGKDDVPRVLRTLLGEEGSHGQRPH